MNAMTNRDNFDRITEDDAFEGAEAFLACMLVDNAVLTDCGLEPEDFAEPIHQVVFREAVGLWRGGQNVNAVSLKPFIPKQIEKLDVSPAEYLSRLMIMGTNPAIQRGLEGSIQIIKSVSLGRQLAKEAQIASEIAQEGHTLLTLADEIEQMEVRLKDMKARFRETTSIVSPGASYLSMFEASAKRDGVIGVPIALPEIARVLSEPVLEIGNLYGLLSSSGEGKSSLTMQIILHAVEQGHPVEFLSYDQSSGQCVRQMIAQKFGITARQQREPNRLMSQSEQDECVRFATWIDRQPLEIIRCQREGVDRLVAYARRFVKRYANGKTPLIVIDHIGKIKPRDPRLDAGRISGEITVELKALADEVGATVLILNQRNTKGMERDNPRPVDGDLYGGEGAKADYDSVLYLYRPQKYRAKRIATAATDRDWKIIHKVYGEFGDDDEIKSVAEIGVIKNRFGDPEIRERLKFEAEYTRYRSMKPKRAQEEMF
jgi:replicative DNA helicase